VARTTDDSLLLGEWACLGLLYRAPSHGFAVATRLRRDGDIGRIWSLSRPLTYRALDQLVARGLAEVVGEEPGVAGGNRTLLGATRAGRAALRGWLRTPVAHVRDVRSELMLKLALAEECGIDVTDMLAAQRALFAPVSAALDAQTGGNGPLDAVALWRSESARAALRFLDRLGARPSGTTATRGRRSRR
jgi:PadR family transcriptional regulator AphA